MITYLLYLLISKYDIYIYITDHKGWHLYNITTKIIIRIWINFEVLNEDYKKSQGSDVLESIT